MTNRQGRILTLLRRAESVLTRLGAVWAGVIATITIIGAVVAAMLFFGPRESTSTDATVDLIAYCDIKNQFDLHAASTQDAVLDGTVDRASVVELRNDIRRSQRVAPLALRADLDVLADAYDALAANLTQQPETNKGLYASTISAPEVAAATERIVEFENRTCT